MKQLENKAKSLDFFIGTLTPNGFKSYAQALCAEQGYDITLLHGAPGGAAQKVLEQMRAHAQTVSIKKERAVVQAEQGSEIGMELLHCAQHPECLEGVVFPQQNACVLEESAVQKLTLRAPIVCEKMLCLYDAVDGKQLHAHAQEIAVLFAQQYCFEKRIARYMASIAALLLDNRRACARGASLEKAQRYAHRLCERYLPRQKTAGREKIRLLSALTPQGIVIYEESIVALASRVIAFKDEGGAVSRVIMETIRTQALARGYEIITCPCAMHPEDKIDHILIPSARLAFVTCNAWHDIAIAGQQNVHCTRFCDKDALRCVQQRVKFNKKAAKSLFSQVVSLLTQAQDVRDALDAYYAQAQSDAAVEAVGNSLAQEIFAKE